MVSWKVYPLGLGEAERGGWWEEFRRAAKTKYCKFGGLKQQKFVLPEFWR